MDTLSNSKLYKNAIEIKLKSGEKIKMFEPSIQQYALVLEVLVSGTKNIFYTEKDLAEMTYDKIVNMCMAKYKLISQGTTTSDKEKVGMFFVQEKTITIVNRLLKQSFPGIKPEFLHQEVYLELFEIMLTKTNNLMNNPSEVVT